MNRRISNKDKKDWESFVKNNDKLDDKDNEIYKETVKYEDSIDLHGYSLRDANIAVKNLIIKSYNKGLKKINIITGKGNRSNNMEDPYKSRKFSILKYSVPEFIQGDHQLIEIIKKIDTDDIKNSNKGEFSVYLKKNVNENRYKK